MISALPRKSKEAWPWNTICEPRPADWSIGMTVCITSHCFRENCLVFATDTMITTADTSSDFAALKTRPVASTWMAMFAGNDITSVAPILEEVENLLADQDETSANVRKAFTDAFQKELRTKSENELLQPLGYDLQEFNRVGLNQLGAENFTRLLYQIQEQSLDIEFLVAGFHDRKPHIFTVSSPGTIADYTAVGFWAIGAGQTNALGSMFNSQALFAADIETTLYRVCEAKFNGENAAGVGKKTVVTVLAADGVRRSLLQEIEEFRSPWEKTRVKEVPADGMVVAEKIWNNFKTAMNELRSTRQANALAGLLGQAPADSSQSGQS
jgi:ATP-dependent protease HslVU (ClpYQ) peptidase subunit